MKTDWDLRGLQIITFERGCQQPDDINQLTVCDELYSDYVTYKDCSQYCIEYACNDGIDIELEFSRLDQNKEPIQLQ